MKKKRAFYIGNFTVRIVFGDGVVRVINFKPFLERSLHPSIRKCPDESMFKQFDIVDGNLNWNDYDMIFPGSDLYEGKIM